MDRSPAPPAESSPDDPLERARQRHRASVATEAERLALELSTTRHQLDCAQAAISALHARLAGQRSAVAAPPIVDKLGGELYRVTWTRPEWKRPTVRTMRTPGTVRSLVKKIQKYDGATIKIERADVGAWRSTTVAADLLAGGQ